MLATKSSRFQGFANGGCLIIMPNVCYIGRRTTIVLGVTYRVALHKLNNSPYKSVTNKGVTSFLIVEEDKHDSLCGENL